MRNGLSGESRKRDGLSLHFIGVLGGDTPPEVGVCGSKLVGLGHEFLLETVAEDFRWEGGGVNGCELVLCVRFRR